MRAELADLARSWFALDRVEDLPALTSFDPVRLGPLIAWSLILDVEADFAASVFTMFGSALARAVGRDWTRLPVREVALGTETDAILAPYKTAATEKRPLWARECFEQFDRTLANERLLLPFAPTAEGAVGGGLPRCRILGVLLPTQPQIMADWGRELSHWQALSASVIRDTAGLDALLAA